MLHNPAASFDLGSHMAAGGYDREADIGYVAQASQTHICEATLKLGAERFDVAYDAWLDAQLDAAEAQA